MNSYKDKYVNSINLNIDTDFPYLVLNVTGDNIYPRNPGFQIMHWHEDLQFIYVITGTVLVYTLDETTCISAGEAMFINKDVIHYVKQTEGCEYKSFLFPASFLGFYTGCPARNNVDSIISSEQLSTFHFVPSIMWHKSVITHLHELCVLEENKNEFYNYAVMVHLTSMWLTIIKNIAIPSPKGESIANSRMHQILRFIEEHYSEDISLADLASSAHISRSECARCFKLSLDTTPYKYLMEFRLSKAAQLLKQTDSPVGDIAAYVGFHQISHFGKCFREKTGCTPREYRKTFSTIHVHLS